MAESTFTYTPVAKAQYERLARYTLGDGQKIEAVVMQLGYSDYLVGVAVRPTLNGNGDSENLETLLKTLKMERIEVRKPTPQELEVLKKKGIERLHPNYY